jgi:hypothetical protein
LGTASAQASHSTSTARVVQASTSMPSKRIASKVEQLGDGEKLR